MNAGDALRDAAAPGESTPAPWRRTWQRWVAFWDRREPAKSLALARIFVGTAVFLDTLLASYEGAAVPLLTPPPFGMGSGATAFPGFLTAPSSVDGHAVASFWCVLVAMASLSFALGAFHRAAGFLLTVGLVNLARFDPNGDAIDTLYRLVVPVLTLSRADACWSIGAWIGRLRGKPPPTLVPAWPRYLLVQQLLWMYFSAALCRNDVAWWPHGDFAAIANVMGDPHFARFPPGSLASLYPLTQAATAISMMFELSAPLMVLFVLFRSEGGGAFGAVARRGRVRWFWLATGAALHLGIALTMTLGMFPFGVLALYPLFFHPDEFARLRAIKECDAGKVSAA